MPWFYLKRNYHIVFAGAYSTYYWQNSSWYDVVYNPRDLPKENQPHFFYYKNIATYQGTTILIHSRLFHTSAHPFCLTDHKTRYLFYLIDGMISVTGSVEIWRGRPPGSNGSIPSREAILNPLQIR